MPTGHRVSTHPAIITVCVPATGKARIAVGFEDLAPTLHVYFWTAVRYQPERIITTERVLNSFPVRLALMDAA